MPFKLKLIETIETGKFSSGASGAATLALESTNMVIKAGTCSYGFYLTVGSLIDSVTTTNRISKTLHLTVAACGVLGTVCSFGRVFDNTATTSPTGLLFTGAAYGLHKSGERLNRAARALNGSV